MGAGTVRPRALYPARKLSGLLIVGITDDEGQWLSAHLPDADDSTFVEISGHPLFQDRFLSIRDDLTFPIEDVIDFIMCDRMFPNGGIPMQDATPEFHRPWLRRGIGNAVRCAHPDGAMRRRFIPLCRRLIDDDQWRCGGKQKEWERHARCLLPHRAIALGQLFLGAALLTGITA